MASACKVTSTKPILIPLISSSVMAPSLVTHYQAESQESLSSDIKAYPLVASTTQLAPMLSGP